MPIYLKHLSGPPYSTVKGLNKSVQDMHSQVLSSHFCMIPIFSLRKLSFTPKIYATKLDLGNGAGRKYRNIKIYMYDRFNMFIKRKRSYFIQYWLRKIELKYG